MWTSYVDPHIPNRFHSRSFFQFLLHTGLGGVQEILLACIIGPVVMYATLELSRLERANWRRTGHGTALFPRVLGASFYVALLLSSMAFWSCSFPLRCTRACNGSSRPRRWSITPVGGMRVISAPRGCREPDRALALVVATSVVSGVPGPLIGTIGLVLNKLALSQAQWLSAGVDCVLYPISMIMATLFYLHVSVAPGTITPSVAPAEPPEETSALGVAPA